MSTRIIIADDHPVVLLGARAVIHKAKVGDVVAMAMSPNELKAVLAHHACDVLVVDFIMPSTGEHDGIEMLARIRRSHPSLPIVLLSAVTSVPILRAVTDVGVLGLVDKAADLTDLVSAIEAARRGMSYCCRSHERRAAAAGQPWGLPAVALSPSEERVLRLLRDGLSVTEIARQSRRSVTTISRQKRDAMRKLGITTEAALYSCLLGTR